MEKKMLGQLYIMLETNKITTINHALFYAQKNPQNLSKIIWTCDIDCQNNP
jgi:hypothetical protein